jgi:hypothetical protein
MGVIEPSSGSNLTLVPAFNSGDDFVEIGRLSEGLWHLIGLVEEAVDGDLEVDHGSKDATFQSLFGELGEEDPPRH